MMGSTQTTASLKNPPRHTPFPTPFHQPCKPPTPSPHHPFPSLTSTPLPSASLPKQLSIFLISKKQTRNQTTLTVPYDPDTRDKTIHSDQHQPERKEQHHNAQRHRKDPDRGVQHPREPLGCELDTVGGAVEEPEEGEGEDGRCGDEEVGEGRVD